MVKTHFTTSMWVMRLTLVAFSLSLGSVAADIYLHNPPGMQNRAYETSTSRVLNNAQRLFDVGNSRFTQGTNTGGYSISYEEATVYAGSTVTVDLTTGKRCSFGNRCEVIVQLLCESDRNTELMYFRDGSDPFQQISGIDGQNSRGTNAIPEVSGTETLYQEFGVHEGFGSRTACRGRERNNGLFVGDENLSGVDARSTRQNPGGSRHGWECPEERDYYPYWAPTEFRDLLIQTTDTSRCGLYESESQNVQAKYECFGSTLVRQPLNETACTSNGGEWRRTDPWGMDPPICELLELDPTGRHTIQLDIPTDIPLPNRCSIRTRLNVTVEDLAWETDYTSNTVLVTSTVDRTDPDQTFVCTSTQGTELYGTRGTDCYPLAVDFEAFYDHREASPPSEWDENAWRARIVDFGGTFQDRGGIMVIEELPSSAANCEKVWDVRGIGAPQLSGAPNPTVPYQFSPSTIIASSSDCLRIHWTRGHVEDASSLGTAQTWRWSDPLASFRLKQWNLVEVASNPSDRDVSRVMSGVPPSESRFPASEEWLNDAATACSVGKPGFLFWNSSLTCDLGILPLSGATADASPFSFVSTVHNRLPSQSPALTVYVDEEPAPETGLCDGETNDEPASVSLASAVVSSVVVGALGAALGAFITSKDILKRSSRFGSATPSTASSAAPEEPKSPDS